MKFKDALIELNKNHKRIWHKQWNKTGFIMKDLMWPDLWHLTLWDKLVEHPSNPLFQGSDDRLYSIIGSLRIEKNDTNENVLKNVRSLVAEYFSKAQHALGMMGFKFDPRITEDDWEIV